MRRINYFLLGATGLFLASCSQNELPDTNGTGAELSRFTVKLPGKNLGSRSLGDSYTATQLYIYAFEVSGTTETPSYTYAFTGEGTFDETDLTTIVDLNLVKGKTYQLVFFAASEEAMEGEAPVYTVNTDGTSGPVLTMNYANMTSDGNLDDLYDCFYGNWNGTVSGPISDEVTLTRPVAQVNWGTTGLIGMDDYQTSIFGENGSYIMTDLEVTSSIYSTINLLSGTYGDELSGVTFNNFAAPTAETYPYQPEESYEYSYIAAYYMLAPANATTIYDFTLTITNDGGDNTNGDYTNQIVTTSVPVQANYQTNIYGSLLTYNASFNITKNATWGEPANNIDPFKPVEWDGTTTYPTIPQNTSEPIIISKPSDLAGLAAMISGTNGQRVNNFSGRTITLVADFDMKGQEFPTLGSASRSILNAMSGNYFQGTFDGNGHTISNFTISDNRSSNALSNPATGFFPGLGSKGQVKNVTFSNITISAPNLESCGGVVGLIINGGTVSNVTVESGSISSNEGAGGIVGRMIGSGTITGCENHASISVSEQEGGGIVGAAYRTGNTGFTISNCTNYGTVTGGKQDLGGIVGISGANVIGCVNNGNVGNNTTTINAGGIVGYANSCGSIRNCTNNGDVMGGSMTAGILAYPGGITYTLKQVIEITGNINNGSITSSGQAAGILCQVGCTLDVTNNTNNAPSITATSTAAGLISNGLKSGAANGGNGYANIENNTNTTPLDKIKGSKSTQTYNGTFWDLETNQEVKY